MSVAQTMDVARVAALAAWRPTQGVYRFDPTLQQELLATPLDGDLPVEHLQRLPEWCVYVDLGVSDTLGFFAHLEYDLKARRPELILLIDFADRLVPVAIQLRGTLKEALSSFVSHAEQHPARAAVPAPMEEIAHLVGPLVSLLLYLCASDADIRPTREPNRRHDPPAMKRSKDGEPYLPPARRPEVWETGFELGAALREASASESKNLEHGPRGHIRRAHWHSYWKGNSDDRRLEIRWLPPIAVNLDIPERATLRRVKKPAS